jgi:endonuclease IV
MSCNCKIQTGQPCVRVLDVKHRVGGHVELKKTLLQTLNQPSSTGSHCVQFYLGSAQGYSCRTLDSQDIEKSKAYCEMYGKTFYVHCPLIANLSKDPKTKEESEGFSILKIENKNKKTPQFLRDHGTVFLLK